MGHHHAISIDIQYKVNHAIYTLQDYGFINVLLFVGGASSGRNFPTLHSLLQCFPRIPKYTLVYIYTSVYIYVFSQTC